MQGIDISIIVGLLGVIWMMIMSTVYYFRPPRWVKDLGNTATLWIDDLKAWAPRLVGSLKHGEEKFEETKGQMIANAEPITQALAVAAEWLPKISKISKALQEEGMMDLLGQLQTMLNQGRLPGQQQQQQQPGSSKSW